MLVKAIEVSTNRKLGPVAATFVSQVSCPLDPLVQRREIRIAVLRQQQGAKRVG